MNRTSTSTKSSKSPLKMLLMIDILLRFQSLVLTSITYGNRQRAVTADAYIDNNVYYSENMEKLEDR
jgi:hypothetical protein